MTMLTIAEAAKLLKLSYGTVYAHRKRWGFFQMEGSRVWRVEISELEKNRKKRNNVIRLAPVSLENNKKCQSKKEETLGGLISHPQVAKELDALLERR